MDATFISAPDRAAAAPPPKPGFDQPQDAFRLSSVPVIATGSTQDGLADELPRSYGSRILCLIARDPRSLFAYWDIDWANVFGEAVPREQKVFLRILRIDGKEEKIIDIEPMAGGEIAEVAAADAGYVAEIGYYASSGEWTLVATSAPVSTPPELPADNVAADVATIPFHISFQRILDLLRVPKQESESLTTMLAGLRKRDESHSAVGLNFGQHEMAETIDELVAHTPPAAAEEEAAAALWTRERLDRLVGFRSSSPPGGVSGGS